MELTDTQRLLLIDKKNDICRLSQEIIEIINKDAEFYPQLTDIKKKVVHIISLLHIICDFGEPSRDIATLSNLGYKIVESDSDDGLVKLNIVLFCVYSNAITITCESKGLFKSAHGKIRIPGLGEFGAALGSSLNK